MGGAVCGGINTRVGIEWPAGAFHLHVRLTVLGILCLVANNILCLLCACMLLMT